MRQLAATIFNYTVGSGIFALPAFAAAELGSAAILAYFACAVIMFLMAACFAEAGSRVSSTGGPYAYVEVALGPFVGFLAGVLLLLVDLSAAAAVTTLFGLSFGALLGLESRALSLGAAAAVVVLTCAINVAGVKRGARLVEVLVAAKLVPLMIFIVAGAAFVRIEHLYWAATPTAASVASTSGFLIFAFLGMEGALTPSGEVHQPSRTVPRAAFLAIGAVTLLYVSVQLVAQGLLGPALGAERVSPLATAMASVAGTPGRLLLLSGAVISMLGFLSSSLMAGPRLLFAFGRDRFAPRAFAAVHPVYRTPHVAIVVFGILVMALTLTGTFERLAILSNVSGLVLYVACVVAAWVLRRRDVRTDGEPFRAPGGPLIPSLACLAIGWVLMETATRTEVIAVALVLAIACLIYVGRSRQLRMGALR